MSAAAWRFYRYFLNDCIDKDPKIENVCLTWLAFGGTPLISRRWPRCIRYKSLKSLTGFRQLMMQRRLSLFVTLPHPLPSLWYQGDNPQFLQLNSLVQLINSPANPHH